MEIDKEKAYEADIQKLVLDNKSLFGNLGKSRVIMEKKLPGRKVIADMLIFSAEKGIIGVEIKTAHDTTQRLNKQLNAYKRLCNQVWVVIADEQYDKVLQVLNRYGHDCVGIITYGQIGDKLYPGIMRKPHQPPTFDPKEVYRMLWKNELIIIGNTTSSAGKLVNRIQTELNVQYELGRTNYDINPRGVHGKHLEEAKKQGLRIKKLNLRDASGQDSDALPRIVNNQMNKEQIISAIFKRLSTLGAFQLAVDMFVNETKDPAKVLQFYHFQSDKDISGVTISEIT